MPVIDIQSQEISHQRYDMYCAVALPPDGAGRILYGHAGRGNGQPPIPDKNKVWMEMWQVDGQGQELGRWRVWPYRQRKIDSAVVIPVGRDVWVITGAHDLNSDPTTNTRESSYSFGVLEGIYTPHATGPTLQHAGECVPPGNLPYFLPNNPLTRAQACKIIASALGLPDPAPGTQSFQDIPEGSPFWKFIEALHALDAVGGYACVP